MTTPVSNIVYRTIRESKTLNILCFFLDGLFEETLLRTGHNFYGSEQSYSALNVYPSNKLYELPHTFDKIPRDIKFDIILCNHREGQLQPALFLSQSLHVPLILIEHALSFRKLPDKIKNTIYTCELLKDTHGGETVIPYGAELLDSEDERDIDVFVYGEFNNRDRALLKHLKSLSFNMEIGGENSGISQKLTFKALQEKLLHSKVFLNLSLPNFTSSILLQAMGCGCAIVSNRTELTEHFIEDKKTGLLEKSLDKFGPRINEAIDNRDELVHNAQLYINEYHNVDDIVSQWSNKFDEISQQVYIR